MSHTTPSMFSLSSSQRFLYKNISETLKNRHRHVFTPPLHKPTIHYPPSTISYPLLSFDLNFTTSLEMIRNKIKTGIVMMNMVRPEYPFLSPHTNPTTALTGRPERPERHGIVPSTFVFRSRHHRLGRGMEASVVW